jgi:hypothetical protein
MGFQIKNEQSLKSWETVENALEKWIKLSFREQNIPKEFKSQMIFNYNK